MLKSIWLTLLLTVLGVAIQAPLSILLGVWAAGHQRNRAVLSPIYFVPLLLSAAAVCVLWRGLLEPDFGIPARVIRLFGTLIDQGAARTTLQVLYQVERDRRGGSLPAVLPHHAAETAQFGDHFDDPDDGRWADNLRDGPHPDPRGSTGATSSWRRNEVPTDSAFHLAVTVRNTDGQHGTEEHFPG